MRSNNKHKENFWVEILFEDRHVERRVKINKYKYIYICVCVCEIRFEE
jgi:hypothetical protein